MKDQKKIIDKMLRRSRRGLVVLEDKRGNVEVAGTEPVRLGFTIAQVMNEDDNFAAAFTSAVMLYERLHPDKAEVHKRVKETLDRLEQANPEFAKYLDEIKKED